ncbi:MAG: hypothetical protein QM621_10195 [Aeromicrobium sp.]|uniref:hypothetical protein n=1 Tax=Aeromicrobium sp. TaxID=1871063 RepID=UPI0039E5C772
MIELVRRAPELVTEMLSSTFGVKVSPSVTATPFAESSRVVEPSTFHADAAFVYAGEDGEAELAVVFEVQRALDRGKLWTWRAYLAHLENEVKAHAALVVYCPDRRLGARYRETFDGSGISLLVRPLIVTPDDVPLVVDPEQAVRNPAAAVLGMVAHMREASVVEAFPAYTAALDEVFAKLGADGVAAYDDLVKAVMSAAVRDEWSRYMSTTAIPRMWLSDEYQQSFEKGWVKGEAEGEVKGKAESLLRVLAGRSFDVSESVRERVMGADREQLERWLDRAVTAPTLEEVFG